ncbi:hypothetical protein GPJ56_002771 [Histomonas meleagridis]|uniref:uncharacterized protein n=1 Tax=Histomonas meleagridis TaxID=135588 RepID=UPI003559C40D|nr:hypothetical protein GPJ56_002771 [Histomonas meleagridis]KAH0800078.1 hypothetical protein GO595_007190 [Histomonas meleagridis]
MQTEEEFAVFQANILEQGQKNFQLKDEIKQLSKENEEYKQLLQQIESLENQRKEGRQRHEDSIKILHDEISKLQEEASHAKEKENQEIKIEELTLKIEATTQQIQGKEEELEKLREKINKFEARFQKHNQIKLDLQLQKERFNPMLAFLRSTRYIPMYIEDLTQKINVLQQKTSNEQKTINKLCSEQENLNSKKETLDKDLDSVKQNLEHANKKLEDYQKQLSSIQEEIQKTNATRKELLERRSNIQSTIDSIMSQRDQIIEKYKAIKKPIQDELAAIESRHHEHQLSIEKLQKSQNDEITNLNEEIQSIRKKLNYMKETGRSPDTPTLDSDLEKQVKQVQSEKEELRRKTADVENEIDATNRELRDKDLEIQTLSLKMRPTSTILAMPEFQEKQLLLEELVLQNIELKKTITTLTDTLNNLMNENKSIREMYAQQNK